MTFKRRLFFFTGFLACAGLIFGAGLLTAGKIQSQEAAATAKQYTDHPLLSRRVFSQTRNDTLLNFVPLRKNLEGYFAGLGVPHSFYFEYLPTGITVGIGDSQELVGASLLKLPVVMDLYRASELGLIDLDKTVTIEKDTINDQYGDLYKRGVGTKLSLRETARIALQSSDNTAILMIQKQMKTTKFSADQSVLATVDADFHVQDKTVLINSKSYASILKCLYYACSNNPNDSQDILHELATSNFHDRIAKPLPDTVPVAHKIGVNDQVLSQSDCGIFYVPKRPYIICMMVGTSEEQAEDIMENVSRITYEAIINND